jgi:hypothetical protein
MGFVGNDAASLLQRRPNGTDYIYDVKGAFPSRRELPCFLETNNFRKFALQINSACSGWYGGGEIIDDRLSKKCVWNCIGSKSDCYVIIQIDKEIN